MADDGVSATNGHRGRASAEPTVLLGRRGNGGTMTAVADGIDHVDRTTGVDRADRADSTDRRCSPRGVSHRG